MPSILPLPRLIPYTDLQTSLIYHRPLPSCFSLQFAVTPGRKVMTNLDSILKSRDITVPAKVHLVKAMVLPSGHVWM